MHLRRRPLLKVIIFVFLTDRILLRNPSKRSFACQSSGVWGLNRPPPPPPNPSSLKDGEGRSDPQAPLRPKDFFY